MSCEQYQSKIEAYADGELDQHEYDQAAKHFDSCPDCQARIAQIMQMKKTLLQVLNKTKAPIALRDRIISALDSAQPAVTSLDDHHDSAVDIPSISSDQHKMTPVSAQHDRRGRWFMPAAMAASIMIILAIWPMDDPTKDNPRSFSQIPAQTVSAVLDQHYTCAREEGVNHHDDTLTRSLATISQKLSQKLGLSIIAPDFSSRGFELVGANRCGISGHPGSHVLYHSDQDSVLLSVFSLSRLGELKMNDVSDLPGRHYFIANTDHLNVIAWHQGQESHILCADISRDDLIGLVEGIRTAGRTDDPRSITILANIH